MNDTAVIGCQWGDEGKGRIVDYLAEESEYDAVIRFQGGDNAGHSVVVNDERMSFHAIPSGFPSGTPCMIAQGGVLTPEIATAEIDKSEEYATRTGLPFSLMIDQRVNIVFDYHRAIDGATEKMGGGKNKIGTTKTGMGPVHSDRAARMGIRLRNLMDKNQLRENLERVFGYHKAKFEEIGYDRSIEEVVAQYHAFGQQLAQYMGDVSKFAQSAKRLLFESAQGKMLDFMWGGNFKATSSNPGAATIPTSVGISLDRCQNIRVIGVVKPYNTIVGSQEVVAALDRSWPVNKSCNIAKRIRRRGNEFGTTTGRPRRMSWFDAVQVKYVKGLEGMHELALTKLDVLAGLKSIRICTGYKYGSSVEKDFKDFDDTQALQKMKPHYETLEGFPEIGDNVESLKDLPKNARNLVERIEDLVGVPINMVSYGPERSSLIVL